MEGRRTITHVGHLQKKCLSETEVRSQLGSVENWFSRSQKKIKIHIAPPPTKYSNFRPRPIPPP